MAGNDSGYQTPMSNQMNPGINEQGDNNAYPYYGNFNPSQQEIIQHTPGQQNWNHPSNDFNYNQFNEYNQYQHNVNQGMYGMAWGHNATPRLNNAGRGRGDGLINTGRGRGDGGNRSVPKPKAAEIEADFLKHGISRNSLIGIQEVLKLPINTNQNLIEVIKKSNKNISPRELSAVLMYLQSVRQYGNRTVDNEKKMEKCKFLSDT